MMLSRESAFPVTYGLPPSVLQAHWLLISVFVRGKDMHLQFLAWYYMLIPAHGAIEVPGAWLLKSPTQQQCPETR